MLVLTIQLAAAIAIALLLGFVVKHFLGRGRLGSILDDDAKSTIARSMTILFVVIALVLVLSTRNETIREDLVVGLLRFFPRLVVGAVILVVFFVLSRLASVIISQSLRQRSTALATRVASVVAASVVVIGILLAMKQMGIETDILVLVVSALLAGSALAGGIAVGMGVLPIARQLAAGRHVEDRFTVGQQVRVGDVLGRIRGMGMASATVETDTGETYEVPFTEFLAGAVETSDD
jgi:small-conductance mechanosensitive channel